jgi:hypothetical protein
MPVLSAARLLLSWVEILACRARPSHHRRGPLNALKRWIDDIKSTNRSQSHERQTKHWSKTAPGKERASGNALRHGQTGDKRGLFGSDAFWVAAKRRILQPGKFLGLLAA